MTNVITRRTALTLGAALLAAQAGAQEAWPTRPIRIIVPFPPGGPADGSARALAEVMGPALGQPVVVENRAGAGGVIGIGAAAGANDGHTLLMGSTSMTITPALRSDLPYDIFRDFAPVGMVSAQPLVLVVPAASPLRDVAGVVAAGKSPGLTSGTSGNGTLSHLAIELFNARTGTQIGPVAYRGESAIVPDLLNATLNMGFLNLPILLPLLAEGKLRALAVGSPQRTDRLPDVPTFAEAGVQGMEAQGWAALLAARGVPEAGLAKLEKALQDALRSEQVLARFAAFGVAPVISTRAALDAYLREESTRWAEVVRTRNIRVQ
jgi:tripartite-type tricarboxylate transporter receptor subunit TctC